MTADTAARIQAVLDAARAWRDPEAASAYWSLLDAIDALPSPDECAALLEKAAKWDRYYSKEAHDRLEAVAAIGRAVESLGMGEWSIDHRYLVSPVSQWRVSLPDGFATGPTLEAAIAAATKEAR